MKSFPQAKTLKDCTVLSLVTVLFYSTSVNANTFSQLSLTAGHENNVPGGEDSPHEEGSSFLNVEYSVGKLYEVGLKNTVVFSAQINASRFNEFRGFDKIGVGLSGNYNCKWAPGAYAPVLAARLPGCLSLEVNSRAGQRLPATSN